MDSLKSLKLPKAPLQEVIFELYWDLEHTEGGFKNDPGFALAQGIFSSLIEEEFPVIKNIGLEGGDTFYFGPHLVHQFWKGESMWPVVQLGPGLLAINDTEKNYDWHGDFLPLIKKMVVALIKAYKNDLAFNKITLKYIDAIEMPEGDIINFVNDNFEVDFKTKYNVPGTLDALNIASRYNLEDETKLGFNMANGLKNGNSAFIWNTSILKEAPLHPDELFPWIEKSHDIVSELFKQTVKKKFYESFL